MGRLYHLERLALGRSPFEDIDPNEVPPEANGSEQVSNQETAGGYQQQYDRKGRPINPATEKQNQELRHAQNAILALVGVVESKEQRAALKYQIIAKERSRALECEHDRGEDLEMAANTAHGITTLFPETLLARIQAGVHNESASFAEMVVCEWAEATQRGWWNLLAVLLPGRAARIPLLVAAFALYTGISTFVDWMQQPFIERFKDEHPRKVPIRILRIGKICSEALCIAADALLLPLKYYVLAQTIGIAPARPLLPPLGALLPFTSSSIHIHIWTPLTLVPIAGYLLSPAALLLTSAFLNRIRFQTQDPEYPPAAQLTSFVFPNVNRQPSFPADPLANIFHTFALFRGSIMRWLGYPLYMTPEPDSVRHRDSVAGRAIGSSDSILNTYDINRHPISPVHPVRPQKWRSTFLAMMAPEYLAIHIDHFFCRLLLLPFESTLLRAVTSSCLASPLPKTLLTASAMANYTTATGALAPFGAWKLSRGYMSKLGLALALHATAELSVFFFTYGLARWQGVRNFNWGDAEMSFGKIGKAVYNRRDEEDGFVAEEVVGEPTGAGIELPISEEHM